MGPITREISLDRTSPDISGFSNQELSEVIYGVSNQEISEVVFGVSNQDISEVPEGKDPKKRPELINNSKVKYLNIVIRENRRTFENILLI